MSANPPVTPPATPPNSDPNEESRFRQWFSKLVSETEADTSGHQQGQGSVPSGQSADNQQTFSLEGAIERVLVNRERRQNRDKKVADLEASNTELTGRIKVLEDAAEAAKKVKRDVFSIFG